MTLRAVAAACAGMAVAVLAAAVLYPRRPLWQRVRPYTAQARLALGLPPDITKPWLSASTRFRRFASQTAARFTPLSDERLRVRLLQADLFPTLAPSDRPAAFQTRVVAAAIVISIGLGFAGLVNLGLFGLVAGLGVGAVLAVMIQLGRVDRAVKTKARRLRDELHTVNQLLALRARAGATVLELLTYITRNLEGAVASEVRHVVEVHQRGTPLADALRAAAAHTPEAAAGRTYLLLAQTHEGGGDPAEELLALGRSLRTDYRHDMERDQQRRRVQLIFPIIIVMMPPIGIFLIAPLGRVFASL